MCYDVHRFEFGLNKDVGKYFVEALGDVVTTLCTCLNLSVQEMEHLGNKSQKEQSASEEKIYDTDLNT